MLPFLGRRGPGDRGRSHPRRLLGRGRRTLRRGGNAALRGPPSPESQRVLIGSRGREIATTCPIDPNSAPRRELGRQGTRSGKAPGYMDKGCASVSIRFPAFDIARAYEELPAHDPERMKGQSKPCWTPFPISTIIVSRTGCRTMDVGSWLRSLGLGQYEAAFRDNAIDAEVLPELTDSDLAKLGVLSGTASACSRRSPSLGPAEPAREADEPRALLRQRTPPNAARSQ